MINLTPFYNANDCRSEIAAPFSDAEYTYATNGHILIRVPLRGEIPESKFAPRADKLFAEHAIHAIGEDRQWLPIPDLPDAIMTPCDNCEHGCSECTNGFVEVIKSVDIGGIPFQRKYLALIKMLPGCTISPNEKWPAWFRFDGGIGLLMPMQKRWP